MQRVVSCGSEAKAGSAAMTAHILLREAEALIEGQTNAPAVDVKAKAN